MPLITQTEDYYTLDVPILDQLRIQEPWWLLTAIIPLILLLTLIRGRNKLPDLYWRSSVVKQASVVIKHRWPKHVITLVILAGILSLVYPAARPVNTTMIEEEKALLIWVYDASESMKTKDVARNDQLVNRLEASVFALEDSLPALSSEHHKLLISYAGVDEINVGIPTLSGQEILRQAQEIEHGEFTATDYALERAISVCKQFFHGVNNHSCEIFVLSDGACNPRPACRLRSEDVTATAVEAGIKIHAVSWGDSESEYAPSPADMKAIADISGGHYLASGDVSELSQLYRDVATSIEARITNQPLASSFTWISRGLIAVLSFVFVMRRFDD